MVTNLQTYTWIHACGFAVWPHISYRTMYEPLPEEISKYVTVHHYWPFMAIHFTMMFVIITQKCGLEVSLQKITKEEAHIYGTVQINQ
jgi:hypothetical protein